MAVGASVATAACPAPVAVHDDGYVARQALHIDPFGLMGHCRIGFFYWFINCWQVDIAMVSQFDGMSRIVDRIRS